MAHCSRASWNYVANRSCENWNHFTQKFSNPYGPGLFQFCAVLWPYESTKSGQVFPLTPSMPAAVAVHVLQVFSAAEATTACALRSTCWYPACAVASKPITQRGCTGARRGGEGVSVVRLIYPLFVLSSFRSSFVLLFIVFVFFSFWYGVTFHSFGFSYNIFPWYLICIIINVIWKCPDNKINNRN